MEINQSLLSDLEEALIEYLLARYQLTESRARYLLLNIHRRLFPAPDPRTLRIGDKESPPPHLSCPAFHSLFPEFPVMFQVQCLEKKDLRAFRLDTPAQIHRSRVIQRYADALEDQGAALAWAMMPVGFSRYKVKDMPVLHASGIHTSHPGLHTSIILPDGITVCLQPLEAFMEMIDWRHPPRNWKRAAIVSTFDEPVRPRRRK